VIHSPPFISILAGHAQWANIELASALVMANLGYGGLMYGMIWILILKGIIEVF